METLVNQCASWSHAPLLRTRVYATEQLAGQLMVDSDTDYVESVSLNSRISVFPSTADPLWLTYWPWIVLYRTTYPQLVHSFYWYENSWIYWLVGLQYVSKCKADSSGFNQKICSCVYLKYPHLLLLITNRQSMKICLSAVSLNGVS